MCCTCNNGTWGGHNRPYNSARPCTVMAISATPLIPLLHIQHFLPCFTNTCSQQFRNRLWILRAVPMCIHTMCRALLMDNTVIKHNYFTRRKPGDKANCNTTFMDNELQCGFTNTSSVHTCIYVCSYMYICVFIHVYMCVHTCIYVCSYMYICVFIHVHVCILIYVLYLNLHTIGTT